MWLKSHSLAWEETGKITEGTPTLVNSEWLCPHEISSSLILFLEDKDDDNNV